MMVHVHDYFSCHTRYEHNTVPARPPRVGDLVTVRVTDILVTGKHMHMKGRYVSHMLVQAY